MNEDIIPGASSFLFPDILPNQLTTHSPTVLYLYLQWVKADYVFGGTETMRMAGERYLPQEDQETNVSYHRRLNRSTLFNAYKNAINTGSGRVFSKDICFEASTGQGQDGSDSYEAAEKAVPPEIQNFAQDVDAQGRNATQFAKAWFETGVNHGVSFLLVDATRVAQEVVTKEDYVNAGARPYWITIKATQVHDVQTREVKGIQKLSLFRFAETVTEMSADGISSVIHQQIRIYRLNDAGTGVDFAVYRCTGADTMKQWVNIDKGSLRGVTDIPIVPFYTDRVTFYLGKPPLQDLIDLNIHHWQVSSDYTNIQHITNVPFLFGKGLRAQMDDDGNAKQFVISPYQSVMTDNAEATLEWVEHTGSSLDAARAYLERVETQMERVGLAMTTPTSSGNVTATENALNASESNSILKSWAMSLQDSINMALTYTCQYLGVEDVTRAVINTDYAVDYTANDTFPDVLAMFTSNIIDAETVVAEAKRRNVIDPAAEIVIPEPPPPPVIVQAAPGDLPGAPKTEAINTPAEA